MAKGVYIGVGGKARKVKKMYAGIGGKARKVKKAYVGVNGVARLFFSSGELRYYGTVAGLSVARSSLAAAAVGDYALFGGGYNPYNNPGPVVDVYQKSLVKSTSVSLFTKKYDLAAATVGNYALFASGKNTNAYFTVEAFNASLVRSDAPGSAAVYDLAGVSAGNYALFGGGYYGPHSKDRAAASA